MREMVGRQLTLFNIQNFKSVIFMETNNVELINREVILDANAEAQLLMPTAKDETVDIFDEKTAEEQTKKWLKVINSKKHGLENTVSDSNSREQ